MKDLVLGTFDQTAEDFRLENIIELGLDQHVAKIAEISASATKELAIEQVAPSVCASWAAGPRPREGLWPCLCPPDMTRPPPPPPQALENIAKTWDATTLEVVPYKDKGHHRIK